MVDRVHPLASRLTDDSRRPSADEGGVSVPTLFSGCIRRRHSLLISTNHHQICWICGTNEDSNSIGGGVCDVAQTDVTNSVVDQCLQKHGYIDNLVNNVGCSEPGCPATISEEIWDAQIDINLNSIYLTCHHILLVIQRQPSGGAVVNIDSIAGLRYIGKPQVAYSATKAAIMQFTKAISVIYADKRIPLNTVVSGLMYSPYTRYSRQTVRSRRRRSGVHAKAQ